MQVISFRRNKHILSIILLFSLIISTIVYVRRHRYFSSLATLHLVAESNALSMSNRFETAIASASRYCESYKKLYNDSASQNDKEDNEYMIKSWKKSLHRRKISFEQARVNAEYHRHLVEKYNTAAWYPFLSVEPDPQEPDYPKTILDPPENDDL